MFVYGKQNLDGQNYSHQTQLKREKIRNLFVRWPELHCSARHGV